MSATISEIRDSRRREGIGDTAKAYRRYQVLHTSDDVVAYNLVSSTAPATLFGMDRVSIRIEPEEIDETGSSCNKWVGEVEYSADAEIQDELRTIRQRALEQSEENLEPVAPRIVRTLTFGTDQVQRKYSMDTLHSIAPTGGDPAPDFNGAIGVEAGQINGAGIESPIERFTIRAQLTNSEYDNSVANFRGRIAKVNNDNFQGYAAGELLYLGGDFQQTVTWDDENETNVTTWDCTFNFAVSPNGDVDVRGFPSQAKQGWDYAWVHYINLNAGTNEPEILEPTGLYIERVYPRASYAGVFPSGGAGDLPVITTQPTDDTLNVGENIALSLVATNGPLTYQWVRGPNNIPVGINSPNYNKLNAQESDSDTYYCLVSNVYGTTKSDGAIVTVT